MAAYGAMPEAVRAHPPEVQDHRATHVVAGSGGRVWFYTVLHSA